MPYLIQPDTLPQLEVVQSPKYFDFSTISQKIEANQE